MLFHFFSTSGSPEKESFVFSFHAEVRSRGSKCKHKAKDLRANCMKVVELFKWNNNNNNMSFPIIHEYSNVII